jgi:hypothetical protein
MVHFLLLKTNLAICSDKPDIPVDENIDLFDKFAINLWYEKSNSPVDVRYPCGMGKG